MFGVSCKKLTQRYISARINIKFAWKCRNTENNMFRFQHKLFSRVFLTSDKNETNAENETEKYERLTIQL